MPKPKKTIRPVAKNIHLAETLVIKVELQLFDELEGRVPHGAWQAYVSCLIEKDLEAGGQSLQLSKQLRGKL